MSTAAAQFWRDLVIAWEPGSQLSALIAVPGPYVNASERDLRIYSADLLITLDAMYGTRWKILFGASVVPTPANVAAATQLLATLNATTPQQYQVTQGFKTVPPGYGWPVSPFGRLLTQSEWGQQIIPANSCTMMNPTSDPNPVIAQEKPLLWPAAWPPPGWPTPAPIGQPWPPLPITFPAPLVITPSSAVLQGFGTQQFAATLNGASVSPAWTSSDSALVQVSPAGLASVVASDGAWNPRSSRSTTISATFTDANGTHVGSAAVTVAGFN